MTGRVYLSATQRGREGVGARKLPGGDRVSLVWWGKERGSEWGLIVGPLH